MITFLKGIVVGLGAIAPGLSGSILLVMFGLYQKVVTAVSTIFKSFKKNLLFLIPLALGIGVGVLLFAKLIDFLRDHFPMQTNYAFLGLILGTLPMLLREVKKEGFAKKYYIFMAVSFVGGLLFFFLNRGLFPNITEPRLYQSFLLGPAVAAAYLVPGVDSAAILSAFGLYDLWLGSVESLNFSVLIPAGIGFVIGAFAISFLFNKLFAKWYTGTYSIIFGLFLSVILNFLFKECPKPAADLKTTVSTLLLVLGFAFSLAFSQLESIQAYFKKKQQAE